MNENKSFSFNSFVSANTEKTVSSFDYLHMVYKAERLNPDFIVHFSGLFWPKFTEIDGLTYIAELFDENRYKELQNEGRSSIEVQFWLNLLEITGLFDDLDNSQG